MKKLKERSQINPKDCWNIEKIIPDDKTYVDFIKTVREENQNIVGMKGHILDSATNLWNYLKSSEKESRAYEKLLLYTRFLYDEDTKDNSRKRKMLEIESLGSDINESESFVLSEFMEHDLNDMASFFQEDPRLNEYKLYFERLYYDKKRILSEREEKIISFASNTFGTPEEAFNSLDNADVFFGTIKDEKGKKVKVSHFNFGQLLESPNQEVRKNVFQTYYEFYKNHKNTFASLLKGNYQELEFFRNIRGYDSALQMALDGIRVNPKVYENLVTEVHKYNHLNIKFQKMKAKKLGLREYHLYDTYVPIVSTPTKEYTKEQAIHIVTEALKPLKEDYLKHFKSMFELQDVDFYPNEGKRNGAYQWGGYDTDSYVLLNFNGTFDSVSTLAHELGHAVHSMYSKENNSYPYYSYEIFLAEIASTVNETLLSFYMLDHAKNTDEKIFYLCEFLDKVKATIYRQTMFAEFESIMSKKCQEKESLTEELFSSVYYDLNKEYFKDSVIVDDEIRYEWMRISHFYRPFYVYQYATGLISAICIVNDIYEQKEGFVEKYLKFLKSGCNKDVLDILKEVDVDLTTKEPFEKAFHFIEQKVLELENLLKEGEVDE